MKINKIDNTDSKKDNLFFQKFPFYKEFFEKEGHILSIYKKPFEKLLQSDLTQELLKFELNRVKEDNVRIIAGSKAEMPLFLFDDIALIIKVLMPDQSMSLDNKYFSSVPSNNLVGVTSDTPLHIDIYTESENKIPNQFNPNLSLTFSESRTLEKSQTFLIEGGKHVDQFKNPSQKSVVFFVLQSQDYEPIIWAYDNKTLKPWLPISSRQGFSRLELVSEFLGAYKDSNGERVLEEIAKDEIHFVRWAAVKNMLKLNFTKGMTLLENAKEDPHPHIAAAASKTSANIKIKIQGAQNANH
ncbi:MAG: hypothetical protein HRT44_06900 [Bdellovibrionales bacterium]|nr:hypothetical protein [Bdellovibrionales bacterium]NQZ18966.1 hypothetical protein [Bdellovibrionales bacterium]